MFIRGKGKEDHLFDSVPLLGKTESEGRIWKADDSMIMAWLINSMHPELSENFLLFHSAREIWEAAQETFSCRDNTAELFEIEESLHNLRQGESSVTTYFTNLTRYWQKVDILDSSSWKCPTDGETHRKIIETKRVFKFLFGLDKSLDDVRGRILSIKPLPSIREAVSEVRREESRRKVMLGHNTPGVHDGSALPACDNTEPDGKPPRTRPWCDHCRKPGHTRETCWKIHGKPANWKPRVNVATSSQFNPDQLSILHNLITQAQGSFTGAPISAAGNVAQQGSEFPEDDWQC
ncbi:uncharacterized protein [Primulina eburnea]|uniref:uncharacterized protein n=1 Tax=Primulina eburnea TaxID=1245227 RepID=UPI003C6CBCDC